MSNAKIQYRVKRMIRVRGAKCTVPGQGRDRETYKILQVRLVLNFFLHLGNISYVIKICLTFLESLNE